MLQIDAYACPGAVAPAHGVDQDVGWLQVRRRLRVACSPALQSRQGVAIAARTANLDERVFLSLRGLDARRLGRLPLVVRRPRRSPMPWRSKRSSKPAIEPASRSIAACTSPIFLYRAGTVAKVKSAGLQSSTSFQCERRRDARVGRGPHRVGGCDRAILGVLVVVDEHAVALLLPPLAGGKTRCARFDFARERERAAAHFVEAPAWLRDGQDVHAARTGSLGPADQTKVMKNRADHAGDFAAPAST